MTEKKTKGEETKEHNKFLKEEKKKSSLIQKQKKADKAKQNKSGVIS